MKIHIPLTKYDINITKRGLNFVRDGELMSFADWTSGVSFSTSTPIMEEVYSTIANEFAKIDLKHVVVKDNNIKQTNSSLNYLVSERPNDYQTKFDFLYTMAYQRAKYGNALAFLERDKNGNVISINPVNVPDYEMGNGYQVDDNVIYLKYRSKKDKSIILADYRNIIHLRANPNDIFYGDLFAGSDYHKPIVKLIDKSLNTLLSELSDMGNVRGIIKLGGSATGYARGVASRVLADQEAKISKQDEIVDRIKKARGGILVLDAGEEWQPLGNPFETASTKEIDKYIDMLLQFHGINKKVVDGTASADAMEVFFYKSIVPIIEQFISESNYKIFSKTAIARGNRIEYYRNPFEYVPVNVAIDIAYKGSMDTTTNERRRMIYKLPPIENGDILMQNLNFKEVSDIPKEKVVEETQEEEDEQDS